jgi:ATP-dependent helicase HrpA
MTPRAITDRYLPPDRDAYLAAEPSTGRVIVIAPTRAACETIELALGLHLETFLEREHGAELRALAASGNGFGIVAGTGTGKTLAIRPIAETILQAPLKVGVVNREREATPETPSWNVIIVTTGIARRWFQAGDILATDTLVVDEIHQTSAELELCLALGKRAGCRFIWLSATVDPRFYARYLDSTAVIESAAFDPAKAARVDVVRKEPTEFLDDRFLQGVFRQKRGVGVFLPTRAAVEAAAADVATRFPRINAAFYHGGEPIRVIRPFLESDDARPYVLVMTAAGQSALNVRGLDTVVIDDTRFANVIERGRNVLTRLHLGANEILQMAGRVHGRVAGGRVYILSDRDIDFAGLRPQEPEFQLAGDSERVALTCAGLGVRADELDLPVPLDRVAYRRVVALLEARGVIEQGHLSAYGRAVEALPVDRPWAELIVHAGDEMLPYLAVMSSIESLHRMTRDERDLTGLIVPGSDNLTAYNVYAEAYQLYGAVGEVYGLPRHVFAPDVDEWAERRGVLVKSIEDAALAAASVYRSVGVPLPSELPMARDAALRAFADLVAQYMPFDLVIDEETADGQSARVSRTSVAGSWGAIAGTLRYFADRFGIPRAAIDGTQISMDLVRKYARRTDAALVWDAGRKHPGLVIERRLEYFGFELERETEVIQEFPAGMEDEARDVLAEALATGQARHPSVRRNQAAVDEVRAVYRRSGGRTVELRAIDLARLYRPLLTPIRSMNEFWHGRFEIDGELEEILPLEKRAPYLALPDHVSVRGRDVQIDYDVEDGPRGVARLVLPEKMARTLVEEELPTLDRPIRFTVPRGQKGTVRAATLDELQDLLDRPWAPPPRPSQRPPQRDDRKGRDGRHDGRGKGKRSKRRR